jgi:hypothetical protein
MERFVEIFNNSMELICLGLYEKLQNKSEVGDYKYSPLLKKALDKFSVLNLTYSLFDNDLQPILPTNETALITTFNFPIIDLINKLPEDYVDVLSKTEWYCDDTYISMGSNNCYYCSPELFDKLNNDRVYRKASNSLYKELELESQKFINLLFDKNQEEYCEIRAFLQQREHAYISSTMFLEEDAIRNFRNKYKDIFKEAYEKLSYSDALIKICPHCGLILRELDDGTMYCVSERCSRISKGFTKYDELKINIHEIWVLRENVARFIYYPGILEQLIKKELETLGITPTLWPEKDTWDFEFEINGEKWVVDAKDVKNPKTIQKDIMMKENNGIEYDKVIYVVPSDRNKNYLEIIRRKIKDRKKVSCITLPDFKRLLSEVVQ